MADQVIVEILDPRGGVRSRARLERFPAGIGRSFTNDVILDDPYACPEHLQLVREEDGTLVVVDTGSMNGTTEVGHRQNLARVIVRPGLQLRVGRTQIRFRDPTQPVAATVPDKGVNADTPRLGRPIIAIAVSIVTLALYTLLGWLSTYERTTIEQQAFTGLGVLLLIVLWAGIWSLASRVVIHRFNFLAHLTLASLAVIATSALTGLDGWTTVVLPNSGLNEVLFFGVMVPLSVGLIAGHLGLASRMSRAARVKASALVLTGLGALAALATYAEREEFTTSLEYPSAIRPVPPSLVHTVSLDDFLAQATDLRAEVDTLAAMADRRQAAR
ncbi:MAG: FHA domain-containing protein [Gemmatimonadaceae bacterium]